MMLDANSFIKDIDHVSGWELLFLCVLEQHITAHGHELDYSNLPSVDQYELKGFCYNNILKYYRDNYDSMGTLNDEIYNEVYSADSIERLLCLNNLEVINSYLDKCDKKYGYVIEIDKLLEEYDFSMWLNYSNISFCLLHMVCEFLTRKALDKSDYFCDLYLDNQLAFDLDPYRLIRIMQDMVNLDFNVSITGLSLSNMSVLGFKAWVNSLVERGYLTQEGFTIEEKKSYLDKNNKYFRVGSVVNILERKRKMTTYRFSSILNCHLAVIRSISDRFINVEIIPQKFTRAQYEYDFLEAPEHAKLLYEDGTLPIQPTRRESFSYFELGIEGCTKDDTNMVHEYKILNRLNDKGEGDVTQYVFGKDGNSFKKSMSFNEAVWYILKEHKITFDEDLFKEVYLTKDEISELYGE